VTLHIPLLLRRGAPTAAGISGDAALSNIPDNNPEDGGENPRASLYDSSSKAQRSSVVNSARSSMHGDADISDDEKPTGGDTPAPAAGQNAAAAETGKVRLIWPCGTHKNRRIALILIILMRGALKGVCCLSLPTLTAIIIILFLRFGVKVAGSIAVGHMKAAQASVIFDLIGNDIGATRSPLPKGINGIKASRHLMIK
jgi:hypothetical protein